MPYLKSICITSAVLAFIGAAGSAALAQQTETGKITRIDRTSNTIVILQTQSGTVGAAGGGATKQFKVQGNSLENLHAGDQVNYSATSAGDITKIEKKK